MIQANELVGSILGEYQIERLLGQSQLAVVYRARHLSQGHEATVTMFSLPADMLSQEYEQISVRFAKDGEALIQLAHPHILPVYAYGIWQDRVYFITAFAKEASLAQFLKHNDRFTPQQTLPLLKQLAEGLDHAHSQGIVHGMLSLANVMVSNDFVVRIAGFGLRTIFDIYKSTPRTTLVTQFTQERNMFLLSNVEYMAPERLMDQPIDARADVYALGVMLFALLSGTQPFTGAQPQDIAMQHLQQPVPSLHSICPEISEAFDLVIGRALERDPAKRLPSAGDITILFERVLKSQDAAWGVGTALASQQMLDSQMTLPPTINWFDEQLISDSQSQATPLLANEASSTSGSPSEGVPASMPPAFPADSGSELISGSDPFAWWATTSTGQSATSQQAPGTFPWSTPVRHTNAVQRAQPRQQGRRRLVALIAVGTAAVGVTIVGAGLVRLLRHTDQTSSQIASGSPGATIPAGVPADTATPEASTPRPTATKGVKHKKPTPTPTPRPSHTGTVIGTTSMATNSAKTFTNPADGEGSLLIRLANGNFVACERACTHEGVPVDYDSDRQKIVCPAHDAVFSASGGFAHLSGPGDGPLPTVRIRVNTDGTITTG